MPAVFFNGAASGVSSFTVIGSTDPQTVNVDETNGALPPITVTGATTTGVNTLNVTLTNATGATDTLTGPNAGTFTFGNRANLNYSKAQVVNGSAGTFALGHQHGDAGLPGRQRDAGRGQPVRRCFGNLSATAANDGGTAGNLLFRRRVGRRRHHRDRLH